MTDYPSDALLSLWFSRSVINIKNKPRMLCKSKITCLNDSFKWDSL